MSRGEQDKRIAYGILRYLQSQMTSGVLDEEGKEGIEGVCTLAIGG